MSIGTSCTPYGSSLPFRDRLIAGGMSVARSHDGMTYRRDLQERRCAFCGRPRQEVRKLVAGPNIYICDRCVTVCRHLLVEEKRSQPENEPATPISSPQKPKEIKERLDQWVIGQDRAKRMLAVAVYNHLKRTQLSSEMSDV